MAHCELCGDDVKNLIETKVSGATLDVCSDCTQLGTIVNNTEEKNNTKNTKYSTSNNQTNSKTTSNNNSNESSNEDYFDNVNDLSLDYGDKIRNARNSKNYTREELSNKMNIKESHLRNIEDEKTQPDIKLQDKLEKVLSIDLSVEDIDY